MILNYYKDVPNVGDELNPIIFNHFLSEYFKNSKSYQDYYFTGIGTLLYADRINLDCKNVIFGTGLRDMLFVDNIKENNIVDFRFVRGPLSGKLLGGKKYITDPAYLLGTLPFYQELITTRKQSKKFIVGIVPYFLLEDIFTKYNHPNIELKIISPRLSPAHFVEMMLSCNYIIAGAMHGAILADLFRIPWCRLKLSPNPVETSFLSDFKWQDWALSIGIKNIPTIEINFPISYGKSIRSLIKNYYLQQIINRSISTAMQTNSFYLSDEDLINKKVQQLQDAIMEFKKDYPLC